MDLHRPKKLVSYPASANQMNARRSQWKHSLHPSWDRVNCSPALTFGRLKAQGASGLSLQLVGLLVPISRQKMHPELALLLPW